MIQKPRSDQKAELSRAAVEALAQALPITAVFARLYQTTHPSARDKAREKWETEVTRELNRVLLREKIIGGFRVGAAIAWSKHGISSVSESGVGRYHVNLATANSSRDFHVSASTSFGVANIKNLSATGFDLDVTHQGSPCDADFTFSVEGLNL